jgi:shikimate kinase
MNIVLIGFMGSGKSAVGQTLAKKLKLDYLDTDELIENLEKKKIKEIFAEKGEPYFRELETHVAGTLEEFDNLVISTGGGMVLKEENVKALKKVGPLVLLWAEPVTIYQRIRYDGNRPLLKVRDPLAEIKRILEERRPVYQQAADHVVNTENMDVEQVTEEIEQWLKSK